MARPQGFFLDNHRAFVEWLRVRVTVLGSVYFGQRIQAPGHLRVVLAERLLVEGQRLPTQRLGLLVPLLYCIKSGQDLETLRQIGSARAPAVLPNGPPPPAVLFRLGILAL